MENSTNYTSSEIKEYDVLIIGAGPAGTTCALALKGAGLRVALIDKYEFPRDKVCGDAIPAPTLQVLNSLNPAYITDLKKLGLENRISTSRLVASNGAEDTISWVLEAYNCQRIHFDNHLLELVKQHTDTHLYLNNRLTDVVVEKDAVVALCQHHQFSGKIIIACDGVNSLIAKKLGNFKMNRKHHSGAVRIYLSNIEGCKSSRNEFFFSKKYQPGYFWIFPVSENRYNAGFGMLSKTISDKKINLEKAFFDVVAEIPELKKRFQNAEVVSKPQGLGLPLGTRKLILSGNKFLLCGDAASLIDPMSGAGIDNAMISGKLAAEHIIHHISSDFNALTNQAYDQKVYQKIGRTLSRNTILLRLVSQFPFVLSFALRAKSILHFL